ncbi:PDR/VanB family oxidoreductase [Arthrobacter sp. MMS18-M83]|uniref:PDR/VanB family oxidoreductase n=1 Tax=Arthrobacter sp. MMS18-M83 TaxID=2996261 RepID=UPI00227A0D75|nr:PDR/VanB family oxidoreductase [Arthrobacter sp. MMS18-M83]WAH97746.1 PDR/VanB family oxidoreductase [Arthrobacter sp. MMS18-M83]
MMATLAEHSTEREAPNDPNARLTLVVAARTVEADGVVSLTLVDPERGALPTWTPGSHIDLHLSDDLVRQYSLSSSSGDTEKWRVSILKESEGRGGSHAAHERIAVGSPVTVSMPRNHFVLHPSKNYVFVAGGIGITPIVSMIEAAQQSASSWNLVYAGRSRSSMAFVEELAHHGDRVKVVAGDTDGRMDFAAYFAEVQPDTLVYACGPESLLTALEAAITHWPVDSLHTERFVGKGVDESADVDFEVEFADSHLKLTIPAGKSILEIAEENDLPVISSCGEGTCGTCETVVLAGLPDHRDSILTDSEKAANKSMFICVSRSIAGCPLKLDL